MLLVSAQVVRNSTGKVQDDPVKARTVPRGVHIEGKSLEQMRYDEHVEVNSDALIDFVLR